MKTKKLIHEEVEKTLQSVVGIERASPKPFFLTRLEARMAGRSVARPAIFWAFRPVWVAASLGIVLMLNLSAVVYVRSELAQDEQGQETVEWGFDANVLDW